MRIAANVVSVREWILWVLVVQKAGPRSQNKDSRASSLFGRRYQEILGVGIRQSGESIR